MREMKFKHIHKICTNIPHSLQRIWVGHKKTQYTLWVYISYIYIPNIAILFTIHLHLRSEQIHTPHNQHMIFIQSTQSTQSTQSMINQSSINSINHQSSSSIIHSKKKNSFKQKKFIQSIQSINRFNPIQSI